MKQCSVNKLRTKMEPKDEINVSNEMAFTHSLKEGFIKKKKRSLAPEFRRWSRKLENYLIEASY